SLQPDDFATYY
nr:immunoglobulin light chain junction region [Homo sapiens]